MSPTGVTRSAFSSALFFCSCESAGEPTLSPPQQKTSLQSKEFSGLGISAISCHSWGRYLWEAELLPPYPVSPVGMESGYQRIEKSRFMNAALHG